MKEVTFEQIKNLGISPNECISWTREVIKHKDEYVLPHKISIKYGTKIENKE